MTQKKKTYELIVEKIEELFLNGKLKSGDKLPPERELASLFGVSRTSVREALQALEISGSIEIRQGGGSFIKVPEGQLVSEALSTAIIQAENNLVYEMLELRRALEVESASLAAQRATSADLEKIRQSLEQMATSGEDTEAGVQADLHFHLQIVQATHNQLLINLVQTLTERMEDTIRATRKHRFSDETRYEDTFEEHKEIYVAIASGNAQESKKLMEEHITRIRKELSETFLRTLR
ncbi:MAG TPA: FadR family transcriptional regulator [Sporosarcina psychrophila]|uniref:FadR family transcriptional regulator n=1 Tax=Sporosarcina psychrophila TaxID=1476 RepID=A0A921KC98_SPOPS|nr:FadR family transcriptional regulator [Sporosarcina psychrophila]